MKKRFSILTVSVIVFLTLATGALAGAAYINWNGTNDYHTTLENLNLIDQRGQELKTERDNLGSSNEQLQNVIRDKENIIRDKENEIEALEKRISNGQTTQDQLRQAEKDMKDVNNKSREVLNGIK